MNRNNETFWADYFARFPIIAFFVAECALGAGVTTAVAFERLAIFGRVYPIFVVSAMAAGAGVGFVIGFIVDLILDLIRDYHYAKRRQRGRGT